jgi:hypothetical protein
MTDEVEALPAKQNRFDTRAFAVMTLAVAALIIAFRATGRLWWCKCGQPFLFSGDINSMHNSQHVFDAYSLSHVLHGIVFFYAIFLLGRRLPMVWKLAIAIVIEVAWEILENSPIIIDRYRAGTIAVGYEGDTVANSLSDVVMALLGFLIARRVGWKGSLAFFIAVELLMLWWIKDNLTLNVLMILAPIPAVKEWQGS